MKKIIFLLMLFSANLFSDQIFDIGGVLERSNFSLDRTHQVILGEFTGAGREVEIKKVEVFVTEQEAFRKKEVDKINFRGEFTGAGLVSEIDSLEIDGDVILAEEIAALVLK